MAHYYVGSVIRNEHGAKWMDICEEKDGKQVIIATIPFYPRMTSLGSNGAWEAARKDALMIVEALNATVR